MTRSTRALVTATSSFLLVIALSASASADMVAPPPPVVTQADRDARVATASRKLEEMPAMFDQCYARSPGRGRTDAVSIRFELRADGRAHRVAIHANPSANRQLAQCLKNAVGRFQWPPSNVTGVRVVHRFERRVPPALAARR